jgi:hypothetical protein
MENKETIKKLKKAFPKGSTAYTKVIHCSNSGMMRIISVMSIKKNQPYYHNYNINEILSNVKHAEKFGEYGLKVNGCGMDMGFHIIYSLSSKLYGDGYAINHRWI